MDDILQKLHVLIKNGKPVSLEEKLDLLTVLIDEQQAASEKLDATFEEGRTLWEQLLVEEEVEETPADEGVALKRKSLGVSKK